MTIRFTSKSLDVISDVFTDLAAGFFGSVLIFPGIFGIKSVSDIVVLLLFNIPFGIVALVIAINIKERTL